MNFQDNTQVATAQVDLTDISSKSLAKYKANFDFIISNPPFHASEEDKKLIFQNAFNLLKEQGTLIFVTENSFEKRFSRYLKDLFTLEEKQTNGTYTVFIYNPKRIK